MHPTDGHLNHSAIGTLQFLIIVDCFTSLERFIWFVCLGFIVPLENFHSYGDVTITCEGLQILTYGRHAWPLSSEGSLACHTYGETGHPFIMVISEDP